MAIHERRGRKNGSAFCNSDGNPISSKDMQNRVHDQLLKVQYNYPNVIPTSVDVQEEYGISRSFRRGATTQARNQRVSVHDIEAANRWRNVENAQDRKINQPMRDHYLEVSQILPTPLRFSAAL